MAILNKQLLFVSTVQKRGVSLKEFVNFKTIGDNCRYGTKRN